MSDLNHEPSETAPSTAGQWIRTARHDKGVHLAVLSAALKVPVRSLEHLEADRYDELPGPTFVRALAQSVCRQLQVDPAPVLALLPEREDQVARVPPTLQTPIPASRGLGTWRTERRQGLYLGLLVLLLALIAGLLWWPASPLPLASSPAPVLASEPALLPSGAAQGSAIAPSASIGTDPAAAPGGTSMGQPVALTVPMPTPVPAGPVVPADVASPPAALPTLRLQASGECWVEVRDARNQVVFSRVMQAGESQDIVEPAPLKVVLGKAAVMQVQLRGQPLDLAPHTKVTVARFEVQP